jgi:hypothetical protein
MKFDHVQLVVDDSEYSVKELEEKIQEAVDHNLSIGGVSVHEGYYPKMRVFKAKDTATLDKIRMVLEWECGMKP